MVFFLEKWIPIEPNHFICNTVRTQEVANGFCHQQHNLYKYIFSHDIAQKTCITIVGRIYVNAPVSSNMITTTVTVIRITPLHSLDVMIYACTETHLRAAAAPKNAYVPGVMQGTSGVQTAKKLDFQNVLFVADQYLMGKQNDDLTFAWPSP